MCARKRIVVLSPLPEELAESLFSSSAPESASDIEVLVYDGNSDAELIRAVSDALIIVGDYTFRNRMDLQVLEAAAPCLLIQQPSVGYQHIDVDAAARLGIPVANAAGANTIAVAEHTIMAALACLKKLILQHDKTRKAEWAQDEMASHGVFELHGKTLGIVGMGRIGFEVARRASPFGCNLIYHDKRRLPPEREAELGIRFAELDDLLSSSDIITLHVPLTPETRGMISADAISRMKPNAVLVNVARGEVVDEEALADALSNERLGGAALDVYSTEPVDQGNPVLAAPNVVLTPHTAGATNESRLRIMSLAIDNIRAVLQGRIPVNIVNGVEPNFALLGEEAGNHED